MEREEKGRWGVGRGGRGERVKKREIGSMQERGRE